MNNLKGTYLMKALKFFLFFTVLSLTFNTLAESEPEELPPLDPAYMGVHGMVLMGKSSSIFAYNLSSYEKPHDVQLLYKLDVKSVALVKLVRDNEVVTIKPKPFNLQRLMRGEEVAIEADVHIGHFDREGMLVYESMMIHFGDKLYMRTFEELKASSKTHEYDVVSYRKNYKIYIHRLQQKPTFDHVIHIDVSAGCLAKFNTASAVPKRHKLQYKFLNCGTMKPFYYDTENFK